jgi:hypothetical protein
VDPGIINRGGAFGETRLSEASKMGVKGAAAHFAVVEGGIAPFKIFKNIYT